MTNGLFWLQYNVANFIFLLKYRQPKVDLNAGEKLLVFITKRHRKFHLYPQLPYTKVSYLRKNTHLRKDAAFLHFRLKESSENMIFPWNGNTRKLMKIWSFLSFSQIFVRRKFLFSCSVSCFKNIYNTSVFKLGETQNVVAQKLYLSYNILQHPILLTGSCSISNYLFI